MKYSISGIGCRFPGSANDTESFWKILNEGSCCISEVPKDRWSASVYSSNGTTEEGKSVTSKGGFLEGVDKFDITFFNVAPKQANVMDPQQRMVLEVVYEALCDARIKLSDVKGSQTGVFVGAGAVESLAFQFYYPDQMNSFSLESNTLGNIANRVSYFYDLKGPSFSVDTACSSAMTALHMAIRSLDSGDCKTAIVVGVNCLMGVSPFIAFSQAKMLSPTGTSRPFDEKANGFVRSEGVGVIILQKPDAITPIQRVYGNIVGCGINEDGKTKSLTMPSDEQQAKLIEDVFERNDLKKENVIYVEAHGTGTSVGDPLEAKSIGETIGIKHSKENILRVGSVKGNIGHMETAAAMGGIIKSVLMLYKQQYVKTVGFDKLNPKIDSSKYNIQIVDKNEPILNENESNLIGVNSYGFGGANGHCVLAPELSLTSKILDPKNYPFLILPISSHYKDGIELSLDEWKQQYQSVSAKEFTEACAVQALTHNPQRFRKVLVGPNTLLSAQDIKTSATTTEPAVNDFFSKSKQFKGDIGYKDKPRVAFVFGGQGSQYKEMCQMCYKYFKVFRDACEEADSYFKEFSGVSILHDVGLFTESDKEINPLMMNKVEVSLPSIVMSQIALVELYRSFGIEPTVVLGHSTGEMIAAWAVGAFSTRDLCRLSSERAKGQANMALGSMAALGMSETDGHNLINSLHLDELVDVACINSRNSITISGDKDAILKIGKYCEENKLYFVLLPINHAYHSRYCESMRDLVFNSASYFTVNPIREGTTFISAALAKQEDGLLDVNYWWKNIRGSVHFQQGLEVLKDKCDIILEIDAHSILRNYILTELPDMPYVSSLRKKQNDVEQILLSLASLYTLGVNTIKWENIYEVPEHSRIHLPSPVVWDHSHIYRMGAWKESLDKIDHLQKHKKLIENSNNKKENKHEEEPIVIESKKEFNEFNIMKLHRNDYSYVIDHKVSDGVVLPGAMYLSIGIELEPMSVNNNDIIIIKNANFKRFLVWQMDDNETLGISINYQNGFYSIAADGMEYMNGIRISKKQQNYEMIPPICNDSLDVIRKRCLVSIDIPAVYRCLSRFSGIEFGKKFQLMHTMYTGDGESITELSPCYDTSRRYHPTVIDSWVQSFAFSMGLPSDPLVPVSCDEIHFFQQQLQPATYIAYNKVTKSDIDCWIGDVDIFTQDGNRVASIRGLNMKYIYRSKPSDFKFYELKYMNYISPFGNEIMNDNDKSNNNGFIDVVNRIKDLILKYNNRIIKIGDYSSNGIFASTLIPMINDNKIDLPIIQFITHHLSGNINIKNKRIHLYYAAVMNDETNNEMFDVIYDPRENTSIDKCMINGLYISNNNNVILVNKENEKNRIIENKKIVVFEKDGNKIDLSSSSNIIINPTDLNEISNCEYIIDSREDIVQSSSLLDLLIKKSMNTEAVLPTMLLVFDKQHCEIVGWCRTARNENPNINIQSLEINSFSDNIYTQISQIVNSKYEHEFEFRLEKDTNEITVPRLFEYKQEDNNNNNNNSNNNENKSVSKEYRIEIDRPGQVDTLTKHEIDINNESLNPDEVRIRVKATAMHFKDIMLSMNLLPGFRPIFGIECSGTIMELGSDLLNDKEYKVGDKVLCVSMDTGSNHELRNSMLATSCICKKHNIIKAPENIDIEIAAGFLGVMVTAYYSLIKLANISKEDTVIIHSAMGGVGLCAIQICKMIGCKIIASAGNEEKRNELLNVYKVDYVLDSHNPDTFYKDVMRYTNGYGANVALNSISGNGQIETLRCLSPLGRFVEIGKRDIMNNSLLNENLLKNNITFYSAHIDLLAESHPQKLHVYLQECIDLLNSNKLHPIPTKIYPIDEVQNVFKMMMKGTHTGKIVISVPDPNTNATSETTENNNKAKVLKPTSTLFSNNKTYLFTGSTRGVGLNIAMWSVVHGARHIVLTGGSGKLSGKSLTMINKVKEDYPNVKIDVITLDVRKIEIVNEFVKNCKPELGGIFHFATQYASGLSNKVTEKDIMDGLDVKVRGAWNLHNATKDLPNKLDYFITASSISGLYGNTMQSIYSAANCSLVGLARYRRSIGLNSLSIDLPMILGCGRLSELQYIYELELNANKGFTTGSIHDICMMLESLLITKNYPPNVTLDAIPWNKVVEINRNTNEFIHGITTDLSLFQSTGSDNDEENDEDFEEINYISNSAIEINVISKLAYILGCKESDINMNKPLTSLGIDSLAAIQLLNWVNIEYQCNLTVSDIMNQNSSLGDILNLIISQRTVFELPSPYTSRLLLSNDNYEMNSNDEESEAIKYNYDVIYNGIVRKLSFFIGSKVNEIKNTNTLGSVGTDSLTIIQLMNWLNKKYNLQVTPTTFNENNTIDELIQYVINNAVRSEANTPHSPVAYNNNNNNSSILQEENIPTETSSASPTSVVDNSKVTKEIVEKIAGIIGSEESDIDVEKPLTDMGVDSLSAVQLMNWLNNEYHINISQNQILSGVSISSISKMVKPSAGTTTVNKSQKAPARRQIQQQQQQQRSIRFPVTQSLQTRRQPPLNVPRQIQIQQQQPAVSSENILSNLVEKVAYILGSESNELDVEKPLTDMGIDSLSAVQLMNWLNNEFHINITQNQILSGMNINTLISQISNSYIAGKIQAKQQQQQQTNQKQIQQQQQMRRQKPISPRPPQIQQQQQSLPPAVTVKVDSSSIQKEIVEKIAGIIGSEESDIDVEKPLTDMGVDSLSAVQLMNWLNNEYHINISQNQILSGMNIKAIVEKVASSPAAMKSITKTQQQQQSERKQQQQESQRQSSSSYRSQPAASRTTSTKSNVEITMNELDDIKYVNIQDEILTAETINSIISEIDYSKVMVFNIDCDNFELIESNTENRKDVIIAIEKLYNNLNLIKENCICILRNKVIGMGLMIPCLCELCISVNDNVELVYEKVNDMKLRNLLNNLMKEKIPKELLKKFRLMNNTLKNEECLSSGLIDEMCDEQGIEGRINELGESLINFNN